MKPNIHVLSFSTDTSIFEEGSAVRARMEHFGSLVAGMDIISFGTRYGPVTLALKNNVVVHRAWGRSKIGAAVGGLRLARRFAKPETVIVSQDPFELGLLAVLASWLTKRPLHIQVHIDFMNPYFRQESWRRRFQAVLAVFTLARARSIRAVSAKIAAYIREEIGISAKKITIAPIFVDHKAVIEKPITVNLHEQFPQFDWIFLLASRFVKQKNIPLAIEAFDLFRKSRSKAGLVIVGSGPEEPAIRQAIEERELGSLVKLGSWTHEFASCMKTSDVFLLSSDYEGWAMTVIEAAALGKSIVMTDVGCAGEFLIHQKNGLVVPARDRKALADAMERYYGNRAFAKNMAEAAEREAATYMTREESDQLVLKSWQSAL
ncbi:MAG: hypothetical protein QOG91_143 [Candidatus Parcubacteria bacterium]|jgi:glycosyltransferase involved in cell wall biosynthesis|nr:hypothetical protein [Candidatus Parcubacteria bacterium]